MCEHDDGTGEPKLSIIIVNYNGCKFLKSCITSLLKSTYKNFEIIIVDNGSHDESIEYLKYISSKEPKIKIVLLNKNYGFAMGNNIGYKYTSKTSKFVFFLNNDTEVEDDCLEKIVVKMELDDLIGAAQPKIRSMKNKMIIDAVGGMADYYGRTFHRGFGEYDCGQYDQINESFYAQGAAIIVRKSVIEKIGLFDPLYFLYYDETDLCWRMHLAGYKVAVIPEAVVYHYGGGSTSATLRNSYYEKYFKYFHLRKNHITTMLKNYSIPNILRYVVPFIIRMLIVSIKWSFYGEHAKARAYQMAFLWVFTHFNLIVRKRFSVQKIRKISDKELMAKMIPIKGF
ncbi:MAG: glycosyltransferase family 2 protein [Candidatus Methanomethylicaceae archaeon]